MCCIRKGVPVFIDFLSFERQRPTGVWIAYGQFVRHFLLPLLLYRKLAMTPTEIFLIHRDGISPERSYQLLGGLDLLSATALELVVLPRLLSRSGGRIIAGQHQRTPVGLRPLSGTATITENIASSATNVGAVAARSFEIQIPLGWLRGDACSLFRCRSRGEDDVRPAASRDL